MTSSNTRTVYDDKGNPIQVSAEQFEKAVLDQSQGSTPADTSQPAPQVVYMARPHEPVKMELSDDVKQRHEASLKQYPFLNLSEGEYVISDIYRHPIGLFMIWGTVIFIILVLVFGLMLVVNNSRTGNALFSAESMTSLSLMFFMIMLLVFVGGIIATAVYRGNRFFLTNESVIQHLQHGIFAKKEQTISLGNIEDASFTQYGMAQHIFGYGSLRLSTEGDETTYRFSYAQNPAKQIAILNNAVEAFKHGRPVDPYDT